MFCGVIQYLMEIIESYPRGFCRAIAANFVVANAHRLELRQSYRRARDRVIAAEAFRAMTENRGQRHYNKTIRTNF